jgi:hypothetical protein
VVAATAAATAVAAMETAMTATTKIKQQST